MMTYNLSRREYRKVEKNDKGVAASHIAPCLRSTVRVAAESGGSSRGPSKMVLELSASGGDEESKDSVAKDAFVHVVEDSRSRLSISSVEQVSSGGVATEGERIGTGRGSIFKVESRSPAVGR